jgi:hypothetical protein
MHSLTTFQTAGVAATYATLARSSTRIVSQARMLSPCANHVPNYTAQAQRACGKRAVALPHTFGLPAIVEGWAWCATSTASAATTSTATTTMHSPAHRRLRHALRRQRCTARPLFTRPARPRRTQRSHDRQRASRKLSAHAVALCASCPPLYCPGAGRPRQARNRLTSRSRAASYCRRLDLVCD